MSTQVIFNGQGANKGWAEIGGWGWGGVGWGSRDYPYSSIPKVKDTSRVGVVQI